MRLASVIVVLGCACNNSHPTKPDAPLTADAAPACTPKASMPTTLTCPGSVTASSNVARIVIIVQENHTFDNYFGNYCTATTGSKPTCTSGPSCCEAAPTTFAGATAMTLDDNANATYDPNHTQACEAKEMDGGKMDGYANPATCGDPRNYAITAAPGPYTSLATTGAIADNYFQPVIGQSSSNDMYLATARFEFLDNTATPMSIGSTCQLGQHPTTLTDKTIGDLLTQCNVPWTFYAEGYDAMKTAVAQQMCPAPVSGCAANFYPCTYDAGDNPFNYYASTRDSVHLKDLSAFTTDLTGGTMAPVVFIKFIGFKSEHPGTGTTITNGVTAVTGIANAIAGDATASGNTLLVVTWDESGGYFDHVGPPSTSANAIDCQPYGARIPTFAVGAFAKTNYISHSQLEHSSLLKFIEWNWFGATTGQLGNRDLVVNNIGDLLDPAKTGVTIPSN